MGLKEDGRSEGAGPRNTRCALAGHVDVAWESRTRTLVPLLHSLLDSKFSDGHRRHVAERLSLANLGCVCYSH